MAQYEEDPYIYKMTKQLADLLESAGTGGMTIAKAAEEMNTDASKLAYVCEILEGLSFIEWEKSNNLLVWSGGHPHLFQPASSKERTILSQFVSVLNKEDKLLKKWVEYMQESMGRFAMHTELKDLQYVYASDLQELQAFGDDTILVLHAPVGTTCEIPHPEDALAGEDARFQIFVRTDICGKFDEKYPKLWRLHAAGEDKTERSLTSATPGKKFATLLTKEGIAKGYFDIIDENKNIYPGIAPLYGIEYDHWAVYQDKMTGRFFYHNRDTDAVQWEEPFEIKSSRVVHCGHCGLKLSRKKVEKHREKCEMLHSLNVSKNASSERKRKRPVQNERSGPPKPINAFLMFCRKNRRMLMNEVGNAGKAPSQISKILGQRWCMLADAKKKEYRELSKKENVTRREKWDQKQAKAARKKARAKRK
eukprot:g1429.t1